MTFNKFAHETHIHTCGNIILSVNKDGFVELSHKGDDSNKISFIRNVWQLKCNILAQNHNIKELGVNTMCTVTMVEDSSDVIFTQGKNKVVFNYTDIHVFIENISKYTWEKLLDKQETYNYKKIALA